jgi:hypothetical protein
MYSYVPWYFLSFKRTQTSMSVACIFFSVCPCADVTLRWIIQCSFTQAYNQFHMPLLEPQHWERVTPLHRVLSLSCRLWGGYVTHKYFVGGVASLEAHVIQSRLHLLQSSGSVSAFLAVDGRRPLCHTRRDFTTPVTALSTDCRCFAICILHSWAPWSQPLHILSAPPACKCTRRLQVDKVLTIALHSSTRPPARCSSRQVRYPRKACQKVGMKGRDKKVTGDNIKYSRTRL